MINQPKFKSCFHIEILDSEVLLLSEKDHFVLQGQLYERLAQLIDGQRTVDQIVDLLQEQASLTEVYYALMLMEQKGLIVEKNDQLTAEVEAFCELLNVSSQEAINRLKTTRVSVTSCGSIPNKEFTSILESLNIQVSEAGDIEVVLVDDYLQESLAEINQKALQSQRPWMLVKPRGMLLWIGPIFYPGKTGCWECLAQRLRTNRPVETYIQTQKGSKTFLTPSAVLPSTWQTGLNLAATEIAKWIIQGDNRQLEGMLITLDTTLLKTQNHILVKRPQCPSCGKPNDFSREPLPLVLESCQKTFTADGGHRCFSPEETLKTYEHHLSPITGVVQELKNLYQTEQGLTYSYSAGHNFAIMSGNLDFLKETIRRRSGGKGKTDVQAKVSAICEALERYSGVFQGDEIRHWNTYQALGEAAIHPHICLNFSEEQYRNRQEENLQSVSNKKIPEPFDEASTIEWTPVWSLTNQAFKYLPTAYCYYGYPKSQNPFCWADSNGTAAGNTREEAILQGFMELVERDSVALWWYSRVQRPAVNLESFDEPYFQAIKDYYQSLHREIWVLDITADLKIPTFAAISRRIDQEIEDIILGFGAHFDPKIAILRAITETNQILPAVLSMTEDGSTQYRFSDPVAIKWWKTANLQNQLYLVPDPSVPPKVYSDYFYLGSDDLREDIITCIKIAREQGMEVLVLDQTRPDIKLNVVKVMVPGMRHFWKRFAPGRLYEVPVKLGWLSKSKLESQLNPFPMFI